MKYLQLSYIHDKKFTIVRSIYFELFSAHMWLDTYMTLIETDLSLTYRRTKIQEFFLELRCQIRQSTVQNYLFRYRQWIYKST